MLIKEELEKYIVGIYIRSNPSIVSKEEIANRLRAVPSVLTIKSIIDPRLERYDNQEVEHSYYKLKYIASQPTPQEDLKYIRRCITHGLDGTQLQQIKGILKLDVRSNTLEKK